MGKTSGYVTIVIFLVISMVFSACNFPGVANNATDPNADQTAIALTVVALQTQLAVNATPAVAMVSTPSQMELPTVTIAPTITLPPVPPLPSETPLPTYKVGTVVDVTYIDFTVVKPGETFKKTWRLKNSGSGTWNSNFKIVFISGDAMGGPASKVIGQSIAPGQTIDISVDLTAPATPKIYQGNWMLQTDGGVNFGIGANANAAFWVKVKVEQMFAVTNAVPVAVPPLWTGACPFPIVLTANITTTAPGKVTYFFKTTLGNSPTFELDFDAAGTKTTAGYPVVVPVTMAITASIYIDNPNHQDFPTVLTIPVTCTP